jgi:hypothetical protein
LSSAPEGSESRLADLRLLRTSVFSEAQDRLLAKLSRAGLARLQKHIQTQVKPHIVIYGDPVQ